MRLRASIFLSLALLAIGVPARADVTLGVGPLLETGLVHDSALGVGLAFDGAVSLGALPLSIVARFDLMDWPALGCGGRGEGACGPFGSFAPLLPSAGGADGADALAGLALDLGRRGHRQSASLGLLAGERWVRDLPGGKTMGLPELALDFGFSRRIVHGLRIEASIGLAALEDGGAAGGSGPFGAQLALGLDAGLGLGGVFF